MHEVAMTRSSLAWSLLVVCWASAGAVLAGALLVDDTGPGIRFIREGVGKFMERF
jgi:hypothetical protein